MVNQVRFRSPEVEGSVFTSVGLPPTKEGQMGFTFDVLIASQTLRLQLRDGKVGTKKFEIAAVYESERAKLPSTDAEVDKSETDDWFEHLDQGIQAAQKGSFEVDEIFSSLS